MIFRTQIGTVKEDEEEEGSTVSELVTSLKSAFQNAYFTQVEEVLVTREEKLKREIESKNREIKLLMEKLQRSQKECGEVKELVSCLSEERDGLLKKVKDSEDDKKEIIELKMKNCELECAKLKAETEADLCKDRFKGLEAKVLSLEKDNEMLGRLEKKCESIDVKIEKDAFVDLAPDNAGKTKANEEAESRLHVVGETVKFETNPNPNPNLSGGSSHKKRTGNQKPSLVDIVEIIDSEDESDSLESAREIVTKEHLHKAYSGQNVAEKEPAVHKRTSASSVDVEDDGRPTERGKRDSGKNVTFNEPAVHKRTSASSMDVKDGRPTERGQRDSKENVAENEPLVYKRTLASSVDVHDGRLTERGNRDSGKNVAENEPALLKKTSASSMDVADGCPTERGKRDSGKNAAENEPAVLKKTSASSVDVTDGRPTERGKQDSGKNVAENEPAVHKRTSASSVDVHGRPRGKLDTGKNVAENEPALLKKTSASSMDVQDVRPNERCKRDSGKSVAENEPAVLRKTSAASVDVEDGRPTDRGKRDSAKNVAENEPAVHKRTWAPSVDVDDGRPTERGKRVKIGKPEPFASPAALNLETHYAGKGDMASNLSKLLSELGDDSSSSSSSDDEVDLFLDYSAIFKPLD